MRVVIKYFATIRERLGTSEETLTLPAGSTTSAVREHVAANLGEVAPLLDRSMVMLNQEYVDDEAMLSDGDEVAIIPPVSGGDHVRVHAGALDQLVLNQAVDDPGAGAIVSFVGVVRDNARGRSVSRLEYEAYPAAAEKMLARICQEMRERWPLLRIAIEHRTGTLDVGEVSVVIAVSSAHRDAAYEASQYAIARIKEIVPIWKKEFYADGAAWIGSERDYQVETGRIPTHHGRGERATG